MQATPARDNPRELAFRSALFRKGFRFRVHRRILKDNRRSADVVFVSAKLAIFLDGCFWHGCPVHGTWPKRNSEWWRNKIEANRTRDREFSRQLKEAGWNVLRIWEHEPLSSAISQAKTALKASSEGNYKSAARNT
jgi:DNA mismatch endonuclease, patch repair protein